MEVSLHFFFFFLFNLFLVMTKLEIGLLGLETFDRNGKIMEFGELGLLLLMGLRQN